MVSGITLRPCPPKALSGGMIDMNIAILSDIHANLDALEAVLNAVCDVDHYIVAGDMVGYYDRPDEVCSRIRGLHSSTIIRGNHDAYVLGDLEPDPRNRDAYRTDWTRQQLSEDNLSWLKQLPVFQTFSVDGLTIRVHHASPWDEESYLYPDTDLSKVALEHDEILILGHTHYPMDRLAGDGRVINSGSVGQPRDRKPGACFAVFDTVSMSLSFHRQTYDISAMQQRLILQGWDVNVVNILSRS